MIVKESVEGGGTRTVNRSFIVRDSRPDIYRKWWYQLNTLTSALHEEGKWFQEIELEEAE